MSRDAAPVTAVEAVARRDIAGWGAFTTPLTVVVLFVSGANWTAAVAGGAVAAVAFTAVWIVGRRNRTA